MNSALTVQFKQLSLFLIICVHLKQDRIMDAAKRFWREVSGSFPSGEPPSGAV